MRTLLLAIAFVLLIGIVLVATKVINISQDANGTVSMKSDVEFGTTKANVVVPTVGTQTKQVDVPNVTVRNTQ